MSLDLFVISKNIVTFPDLALTFKCAKYKVSTIIVHMYIHYEVESNLVANIEPILRYLAVASHKHVSMFQMLLFLFDLTCDVIGDPEVKKSFLQQLRQGYPTPFEF